LRARSALLGPDGDKRQHDGARGPAPVPGQRARRARPIRCGAARAPDARGLPPRAGAGADKGVPRAAQGRPAVPAARPGKVPVPRAHCAARRAGPSCARAGAPRVCGRRRHCCCGRCATAGQQRRHGRDAGRSPVAGPRGPRQQEARRAGAAQARPGSKAQAPAQHARQHPQASGVGRRSPAPDHQPSAQM
ncbi:hypothetical protein IWQ56_006412, partial [Coemansia nantahalensis]